jgi:hypothetical protein
METLMREQSSDNLHLRQLLRARRRRALILNLAMITFIVSISCLGLYAWLMSPAGKRFFTANWYRVHHQLLWTADVSEGPWDSGAGQPSGPPDEERAAQDLQVLGGMEAQTDLGVMPVSVVDRLYMPLEEVESFYIHRAEHDEQVEALQQQIDALTKQLREKGTGPPA